MNQEQIAKLKELAQAATPGPWRHDGIEYGDMGHRYQTVTAQNDGNYVVGEYGIQEHDAAFISAANPAAILELIALAERALLAAAPAPIQKEPEATHKRQVFMDEIDAAKAGSEWLEPFFGPGFRLSFSVDEGARAPQAKWCMLFDSLDRVVAGYMLTRDAKNWTELTKVGPHATPPALAGGQVQAAGDAVLEKLIAHISDNWSMKKYTLVEIADGLEVYRAAMREQP